MKIAHRVADMKLKVPVAQVLVDELRVTTPLCTPPRVRVDVATHLFIQKRKFTPFLHRTIPKQVAVSGVINIQYQDEAILILILNIKFLLSFYANIRCGMAHHMRTMPRPKCTPRRRLKWIPYI